MSHWYYFIKRWPDLLTLKIKRTSKIQTTKKNEYKLKNEDNLKNEFSLKNEDKLRNKDNIKVKTTQNMTKTLRMKTTEKLVWRLHTQSWTCFKSTQGVRQNCKTKVLKYEFSPKWVYFLCRKTKIVICWTKLAYWSRAIRPWRAKSSPIPSMFVWYLWRCQRVLFMSVL